MTVDEILVALITSLQSIATSLANIAKIVPSLATSNPATRIALALPIITRNGKVMNFQLANDTVADILITDTNDSGAIVAAVPGDVYSVVSGDPSSLGAVIGKMPSGPFMGAPSLRVNALVKLKPGITATVSDADGLKSFIETIDIVESVTPTAISLDLTNVVLTPQAVPAS
jgi:hypothetical protein